MKPERELRCFCGRRPLLGLVRRDVLGQPFLHVKVFKQGRVFGEVVANSGVVRVRCRDCQRWHKVTIRRHVEIKLYQPLPPSIPLK